MARRLYARLRRSYPRWGPLAYKSLLGHWLVLAVAVPLLLAGVPFVEWLNDMAAQPKGKTQGTVGRTFGEHRIVDRDSPSGAVPRDLDRYAFDWVGNDLADAQWVGRRLTNPVALTVAHVQRGRAQYDIYCIACHGPRANGDGSATGANRFPPPPTLHTDQARGYADGTIFHIITKGTGKMPAYNYKLAAPDRWKVIYYVRALQLAATHPPGTGRMPMPQMWYRPLAGVWRGTGILPVSEAAGVHPACTWAGCPCHACGTGILPVSGFRMGRAPMPPNAPGGAP